MPKMFCKLEVGSSFSWWADHPAKDDICTKVSPTLWTDSKGKAYVAFCLELDFIVYEII